MRDAGTIPAPGTSAELLARARKAGLDCCRQLLCEGRRVERHEVQSLTKGFAAGLNPGFGPWSAERLTAEFDRGVDDAIREFAELLLAVRAGEAKPA